jgi:hypothetical protein
MGIIEKILVGECVFDVKFLNGLVVFCGMMFAGVVSPVGCPAMP